LKIYYNTDKRDPRKEGKFYAHWKSNRLAPMDPPHIILNATGRGHYVGTLLQAQGLTPGMTSFFEGDDSTATDGHFRIHGTGSEDYFNGGWYACPDRWDSRQSLPIHGALDYSLPFCRTGGYRLYLSDKIPFEKSIYQSIEHGLDAQGLLADYTSVSFYYCDHGGSEKTPTNEQTRVYEPDTLMMYPQLMQYTLWGSVNLKAVGLYSMGGRSCQYTSDNGSRLKIALSGIPEGKYTLYADLVKYSGGCQFAIWQGQTRVSDWINTNQTDTERINTQYLCELDTRNLPESLNSITLTFRTKPEANSLLLNRLILVKRRED
jgi:D-arabinan exo alpha-(1,3)/(1,5)-arabinofuranosidase (non-reducing end)